MKSMIKEEPKKGYYYTELPVPEPVKDEVLIKVEKVAICGSDINLFLWNEFAKVIATIPFTPGHEATGVVVKAGPEATVEVGTRVAVENHFYCGDCYTCEVGNCILQSSPVSKSPLDIGKSVILTECHINQ